MKKPLLLMFLVFMLTSMSYANGPMEESLSSGIGAKIDFNSSEQTSIFIPIIRSQNLMLEIQLSRTTSKTEETSPSSYGSEDKETRTSESSELGLGVFSRKKEGRFNRYYGIRFGIINVSSKIERVYGSSGIKSSAGLSGTGYTLAPSIGAEFFIVPKFSLAGEAQYFIQNVTTNGKSEASSSSSSASGDLGYDSESIKTRILFIVRWYF